jgi:hypothetical protein
MVTRLCSSLQSLAVLAKRIILIQHNETGSPSYRMSRFIHATKSNDRD